MPKHRTGRFDRHDPGHARRERLAADAASDWVNLLTRPRAGNISSDTRAGRSGRSGR